MEECYPQDYTYLCRSRPEEKILEAPVVQE